MALNNGSLVLKCVDCKKQKDLKTTTSSRDIKKFYLMLQKGIISY